MSRRLALVVAILCAACKPSPQKPPRPAPVPTVRAMVVTLRTTIEGTRPLTHTIVIRGDQARSTAEHDTWHLFDVKAKTVTIVDDVERTVRTEPLATFRRRRESVNGELPAHYPVATLTRSDETRDLLGLTARRSVIEAGAYRRELWIAEHRSIPSGLFAMMQVVDPPSSPLVPMMRKVDDALARVEGFPLLDHAEVSYGSKKYVVDREVVSVAEQNVPATVLGIPAGYRVLRPTL